MTRSIFSLAASLAFVGASNGMTILDGFESYSPLLGDMNGQGGWTVTNGDSSPNGPTVIVDSYTWDGSNQSATVGGFAPQNAAVTSLYHAASVPFVGLGSPTSFSFETSYTESTNAFRNPFQFVLKSSSGANNNLLTIDLTPAGAGEYNATWSSDFATGGLFGVLAVGDTTKFTLDLWNDGPGSVGYSFSNAGNPIQVGVFAAAHTDTITGFETNWYSNIGGGVGDNSITIDNVSLIPEPSSALLGLLGTSCLFLRRRRA